MQLDAATAKLAKTEKALKDLEQRSTAELNKQKDQVQKLTADKKTAEDKLQTAQNEITALKAGQSPSADPKADQSKEIAALNA